MGALIVRRPSGVDWVEESGGALLDDEPMSDNYRGQLTDGGMGDFGERLVTDLPRQKPFWSLKLKGLGKKTRLRA